MPTTTTGRATDFITFSRASLATVTDSDGRIKWAPHNLALSSEQIADANWTQTAGVTVTANSTAAPNGTTTADTLAFTSSGYTYQTVSTGNIIGTRVTLGVWLWSATGKATILLRLTGATTGADNVATLVSLTSTPTLYTVSRTFTSTDTSVTFGLENRTAVGGDGIAGNVITWGAHLYRSDLGGMQANTSVYPMYNPTTAAAYHGPRLDFDGTSQSARGLLVEEQRANLLTYSEQINDTSWTKFNTTVSANAAVAPDGTTTADKIIANSGSSAKYFHKVTSTTASTSYSWSIFLKAAEYTTAVIYVIHSGSPFQFIQANVDLTTGVVSGATTGNGGTLTSAVSQSYGNGWWRVSLTGTIGTGTSFVSRIYPKEINAFAGDDTSGILAWGAQLEAGLFPTSYIPTGASTVTRSADVATVATSAFPYNVNSSSLVIAASQLSELAVSSWTFSLDNGTGNDRCLTIIGPNRPVNTQMTSSLVGQFNQSITPTSTTTPFKHAFAYELNNANMAVNGVLGTDDTTVTPPAAVATTLRIGTNTIQSVFFNGHIRQITYLPRRISNTELIARTA